jgi:4'-phosphopantetheinyl transferase
MIHHSSEKTGPIIPYLENQTVHVWRLNLPMSKNVMEKFKSTLSADEVVRANNFHFNKHREQFIASRGGLRNILSRYLKILPQDIQLLYTSYGKPYLNHVDLSFNISHSGNDIVCAITKNVCIGIDIEQIKCDMDVLSLAKKIFSEEEYVTFLKMSDKGKLLAFYRYWTRKEAYLKAIGTGLHYPLDQVQVSFSDAEKPKLLKIRDQPFEPYLWHLEEVILEQACIATLAIRQKYQKIHLWNWRI